MADFCKSARVAGLLRRLPVVIVLGFSALASAQVDAASTTRYLVSNYNRTLAQTLVITKDSCDYTEVKLASGERTRYGCHVLSGTEAVLMGQAGPFVVSFDTPSGVEVHQLTLSVLNTGSFVREMGPPRAGAHLNFSNGLRMLSLLLPDIRELSPGPYAVPINAPSGTRAQQLPNVSSPLHFDIKGTDCTVQYAGRPKSACALTMWFPIATDVVGTIDVAVSGAYLKQDTPVVSIRLSPVYNDPGHWFFVPTQFPQYSPLLLAVKQGDIAAVQTLLGQGADPNAHSQGLDAPLVIAESSRRVDIANLLVDHRADVNATTKDGATVLTLAVAQVSQLWGAGNAGQQQISSQWSDFARKLVAHGAKVNQAAPNGTTPLLVAVANMAPDMVEFLLDSGADVDASGTAAGLFALGGVHQMTPYEEVATYIENLKKMEAEEGAETNGPDPLAQCQEIMDILAKHGAKFLPNGGALAADHIHLETGSGGAVTLIGAPGAGAYGETVTLADITTGKVATAQAAKDGSFRIATTGAPSDLYRMGLSSGTLTGSPIYMHGNDPALTLHVDSPAAGSTVDTDEVTVTGTYTGPANVGLLVGEQRAIHFGNRFVAANVRLKPGKNTLTVTASTLRGLEVTQQLDVTSRRAATMSVDVTGVTGLKADALTRVFIVHTQDPGSVHTLKVSYLGGAKDDVVMSDPKQIREVLDGRYPLGQAPLSYRYPGPGIYEARITLVDGNGAATTLTQTLVIPDPDMTDEAIRSAWSDFTEALAARDEGAALAALSDGSRDRMKSVLDAIIPNGSKIVASFSPLMGDKPDASASNAEYVVRRTVQDPKAGNMFFIEFIRYPDGVWHIDSM